MRVVPVVLLCFSLATLAACSGASDVPTSVPAAIRIPDTVQCADASGLRDRVAGERESVGALTSDQDKVDAGSRANFLASLATIADLRCRVQTADAGSDELIARALDAGRTASETAGFYERNVRWSEATLLAQDAITHLLALVPIHE